MEKLFKYFANFWWRFFSRIIDHTYLSALAPAVHCHTTPPASVASCTSLKPAAIDRKKGRCRPLRAAFEAMPSLVSTSNGFLTVKPPDSE